MQEFCDTIERPEGYSEPEFLPDGYLIALGALAFIGPIVLGSEWTGEEIAARSSNQRERERQDAYGEPKLPRELNFDIRDPGYREKFETARAALPGKDLKEDEARERRNRAVDVLRQSLYSGRVLSLVLSKDGQKKDLISPSFWGSKGVTQVFDKGVASVDKGGPPPTQFTAKGHVIFSRVSLESAFDIKAKAGGRRRGRKPAEETRNREILDEFCKMEANGEVSFDHGGKEAIIRALACCFPGYSPGGIRSIIEPAYDDIKKSKGQQKKTAIK